MKKLLIILLLVTPAFAKSHKGHKDSSLRRIGYHHVVKPVGHASYSMLKKLVG